MELERCNCMTLRKAARRVSNFYDSVLAPSGLRATQYSILALLNEAGAISINDLARHLDLDRTTTGKNLRPLEVAKLVKLAPSPSDGRRRLVTLTEDGMKALRAARPLWRRAQADFENSNGKKLASDLRQLLSGLTVDT